jgi:hypothetical protein
MKLSIARRLGTLAALCLGAFIAQSSHAQSPGMNTPGWDYLDPVNIAEARIYARHWFAFKDTGVVSPEFQAFRFTNPAPQGVMTPFHGAEVLFEKLYAHRLVPWEDGTPWMYGLNELMRDDPAVAAAFRLYATTGKFVTLADGEVELPVERLMRADDDLFSRCVRIVGYDGVNLGGRVRDLTRLADAFKEVDAANGWLRRDAYLPGPLDKFPKSLDIARQGAELIPVYAIVDPAEIDATWSALYKASKPNDGAPETKEGAENVSRVRTRHPPLDGSRSLTAAVYIEPTTLSQVDFVHIPWPTWADAALKGKRPEYPKLAKGRWSTLATTDVGLNKVLVPSLQHLKAKQTSSFYVFGVSASAWRIVPPAKPLDEVQDPRGELVFPLWESIGLVRDAAADPWTNKRNGPMSSHVESPDFEWTFQGRSSFVFPAPIPREFRFSREYVVLPESLAKQPVPVMSVYKAKTWKPFAEDYVFRLGPPTTTEGLRAVCVFMTATDEQLRSIATAMGGGKSAEPPAAPVPEKP